MDSTQSDTEKNPDKGPMRLVVFVVMAVALVAVVILGSVKFAPWSSDEPTTPSSVAVLMQTKQKAIDTVYDSDSQTCVSGTEAVKVPGSNGGKYAYGDTVISTDWWDDNGGVTVTLTGGAEQRVVGFLIGDASDHKVGTVSPAEASARTFTLNKEDFGGSTPEGKITMCVRTPNQPAES